MARADTALETAHSTQLRTAVAGSVERLTTSVGTAHSTTLCAVAEEPEEEGVEEAGVEEESAAVRTTLLDLVATAPPSGQASSYRLPHPRRRMATSRPLE